MEYTSLQEEACSKAPQRVLVRHKSVHLRVAPDHRCLAQLLFCNTEFSSWYKRHRMLLFSRKSRFGVYGHQHQHDSSAILERGQLEQPFLPIAGLALTEVDADFIPLKGRHFNLKPIHSGFLVAQNAIGHGAPADSAKFHLLAFGNRANLATSRGSMKYPG